MTLKILHPCPNCSMDVLIEHYTEQFEAFEDIDGDGYGSTPVWTCSLETDLEGNTFEETMVLTGGDCWDSSWSTDSVYAFPGAAENETDTNEDGELLSELCLLDVDEDGFGDIDDYYSDASGTDCDDDDTAANIGVWGYIDADGDGFGDDDTFDYVCSLDIDDDGTDDLVEIGGDCDDTPETSLSSGGLFTYPGAAAQDSVDECLTDFDGDGYGANNEVSGLYEANVSRDDVITVTLYDSWTDTYNGSVDLYIDYVWVASYEGPTGLSSNTEIEISYDHVFTESGLLQVGWTEPSSFNSELSFEISDSSGNLLFDSGWGPEGNVPMPSIGSDSDDNDASIH